MDRGGATRACLTRGDLVTCEFVRRDENLVLCGQVGTGKAHMLVAIGTTVCSMDMRALLHDHRARDAPLAVEARRGPPEDDELDRALRPDSPGRVRLRPRRPRRRQAPVPGDRRQLRAQESGDNHQRRLRALGHRAHRRPDGRRDRRQGRPPREAARVRGREPQVEARAHAQVRSAVKVGNSPP